MTVTERYKEVKDRVAQAALRAGRSPGEILVVAVSKYAEMEQVRELIQLGHRDFGESRAQQLLQRAAMVDEMLLRRQTLPGLSGALQPGEGVPARSGAVGSRRTGEPRLFETKAPVAAPDPGAALSGSPQAVRWHMIGHLQRNKVKKIIGVARLIQSVDSLRLVEEIQHVAFKRDEPVDVLVQVNCSGEKSRFGCAVAAAMHLCEQIDTMVHLRVRGLMTMAPYSDDPEGARIAFDRCREVFDDIKRREIGGVNFNILSMGMSHDFEVAIDSGSNMVRLGTTLFGEGPANAEHDEVEEED